MVTSLQKMGFKSIRMIMTITIDIDFYCSSIYPISVDLPCFNCFAVFEGSEQEPVKSVELQQGSFFTTNTATPSQSSCQDLEQNKEIYRFVKAGRLCDR